MAKKPIPTPEQLRQLLRYEPETGKLYWLHRGPEWFSDGQRDPSRRARTWNTKYAGKEAFTSSIYGTYKIGSVLGIPTSAHRVGYSIYYGIRLKAADEIDHINGDKSDNTISNLRLVTHGENAKNISLYKNNKSGVMGLHWERSHKAWAVSIHFGGRQHRIGRFKCFGRAVVARKEAEKMHGYHQNHGRAGRTK